MTTNLEYEKISYTVKETGAVIRAALKAAWPATKFSLRGSRGTGYGWYSLSWTDGPTESQVRELTDSFRSSYFDGMDDSTHTIPATMFAGDDGVIREHKYACDGVNGSRDYSPEARAWLEAYVEAHGGPEYFAAGYYPDLPQAVHTVGHVLDFTGIDWNMLPAPVPGFTGRHVPNSYCVDQGREQWTERPPAHRATCTECGAAGPYPLSGIDRCPPCSSSWVKAAVTR